MGDIKTIILNIKVNTFSSFDSFLTNKPAIACVKAAMRASTVPNLTSKSGLIIIIVKINPKNIINVFFGEFFSFKKMILPKYINKGVLKLIAITWESGIKEYDQKRRIMVIPPNIDLRMSRLKLAFFFNVIFLDIKKGIKKIILIIFLKKACSTGWINCDVNFMIPAKTENKKHEVTIRINGDIYLLDLSFSFLQFSFNYVNKNNVF